MRALVLSLLATTSMFVAGCSDEPTEPEVAGDCSVRIEYDDVVYRVHNLVDPDVVTSAALGVGQPVDCEGREVTDYRDVSVSQVVGVEPAIAIAVDNEEGTELDGIYVAEGIGESELPDVLLGE